MYQRDKVTSFRAYLNVEYNDDWYSKVELYF